MADYETAYVNKRREYDRTVHVTMRLSLNQHGIDTDGRGVRAVKLFTRQTLVAMTLKHVLPDPPDDFDPHADLWDLCSVASLTRNLIEGYIYLRYFGTEKVTPEDAELRFFLGQYHRNKEWYLIRKATDERDPELLAFETGLPEQEDRLKDHPYLGALTPAQQNRVRCGNEMYKTKADFEAEDPVCTDLRRDYRMLSNLIHPLPLSIERISNESGRGIGSAADVSWCLFCVSIASRYLAASTLAIAERFPTQLGVPFKDDLEAIRAFQKNDC